MDLESELAAARDLSVARLARIIEDIGFECTRCGACCKGHGDEHTATVFPDEIRHIMEQSDYDWRDVARPMPFGLEDGEGETFEWALQTDACGDCTFYEETDAARVCTIYGDRPLICQTYPFSIALNDEQETAEQGGIVGEPMGDVVQQHGPVRAHECEGLGRSISNEAARELAATLKERTIRELEEAIQVRDQYERPPTDSGVVVHDSEGQKRPDGSSVTRRDDN